MTRSVALACGVLLIGAASSVRAQFDRGYCFQPADPGPCECYWPRYYYNASTGYCEVFIYGCCEGNENNFLTLAECEAACVPTPEDCLLPYDIGPCDGICPRFFYNAETGRCEPFGFGCCDGNANNFLTQEACEATCPYGLGAPVPAVSEWGLVVMAVVVFGAGGIMLSRRKQPVV
ncbi:MAG: BPTI/Kunitz-type proteinase inhibitor domain-containing protein [Phycisphaerae bacterium]